MISRLVSSLAAVTLLGAFILASAVDVEAQGDKYTVKEMRKRFYRKGNYTVGDLHWCLLAKKMGYCATFIQGVADAARLEGFRYKDKPLCWPKGARVPLPKVVAVVMKEERLLKWTPRDPAAAYILSALAEAYPCKK